MKRSSSLRAVTALAVLLALAGTCARADEPTASPLPKPEAGPATVFTFGRENPDCTEWTDACRVCTRTASGEINCSTAGIACVPAAPICRVKKAP
jgi:hypothetical protein